MRVSVSQIVPGCVLLKDVMGKTSRPIIPKNTVLEDYHVHILKKFLVPHVEVSQKLSNGELYIPQRVEEKKEKSETKQVKSKITTFHAHYLDVVHKYKQIFIGLQNNMPFNITEVRNLIVPILERTTEVNKSVYTLHHHSNKEDYIYHHSVAVGIISSYIARKLGYDKKDWIQIGLAGCLSDCGMAKISPNIVFKEGFLTKTELEEIKKHPTYSYRFVEPITSLSKHVKLAILQHHERMDGSGYPLGINGKKIHPFARIIAISDMYHAMTSERVYKGKQSPFQVIEEIQKDQFSKLDIRIVRTFIRSLTNLSIGTKVKLSNKKIGEIIFIDPNKATRPMVRLEENGEIISLQTEKDLFIEDVIISS